MSLAKKNSVWHFRRIAHPLERKSRLFIGKTKVAEVMREHGLLAKESSVGNGLGLGQSRWQFYVFIGSD